MTPIQDPTGSLALELERLRGTLNIGFSDVKGQLGLLVQRTDQTDRAMGEQRDQSNKQGDRLSRLERWMWLAIGASGTLGTVGGWVAGSLGH